MKSRVKKSREEWYKLVQNIIAILWCVLFLNGLLAFVFHGNSKFFIAPSRVITLLGIYIITIKVMDKESRGCLSHIWSWLKIAIPLSILSALLTRLPDLSLDLISWLALLTLLALIWLPLYYKMK